MKYLMWTLGGVASVLVMFLVGFAMTGADLAGYAFWAPKYKSVERQVYQQTPSYIQGNNADMLDMVDKLDMTTDPGQRQTLLAALRDKVNHLPPDFPVSPRVLSAIRQ